MTRLWITYLDKAGKYVKMKVLIKQGPIACRGLLARDVLRTKKGIVSMKPFSFAEEAEKASGNTFKFQNGDNRVRIVSEFRLHQSNYEGKPRSKFVGYIIDRRDGAVKIAFLAKNVMSQIADYQMNPDYAFEAVPMPYDINIYTKNAGVKEVEYNVQPARQNTPLTEIELKAIAEVKPIDEYIRGLQDQQEEDIPAHSDQLEITPVAPTGREFVPPTEQAEDPQVEEFHQEALDSLSHTKGMQDMARAAGGKFGKAA